VNEREECSVDEGVRVDQEKSGRGLGRNIQLENP
jgi:hypothetical protein